MCSIDMIQGLSVRNNVCVLVLTSTGHAAAVGQCVSEGPVCKSCQIDLIGQTPQITIDLTLQLAANRD